MMLRIAITALSLAGLVISIYFTFAYYGRVKKSRWVPEILCAREGSNCVTVVQTPYARVFGVPNSLLGIIYYLLVISDAINGFGIPWYYKGGYQLIWPFQILIPASLATVLLGFYLIYALQRKLRINCALCYTAHAINLALLLLLIVAM